jgi:hypothetical protein
VSRRSEVAMTQWRADVAGEVSYVSHSKNGVVLVTRVHQR